MTEDPMRTETRTVIHFGKRESESITVGHERYAYTCLGDKVQSYAWPLVFRRLNGELLFKIHSDQIDMTLDTIKALVGVYEFVPPNS